MTENTPQNVLAFEGKTLLEAVEKACTALGVEKRDLKYRLDPDHFRGGATDVRILTAALAEESPPDREGLAREYLTTILEKMGIPVPAMEVLEDGDEVRLLINDPSGHLFEDSQVLEALRHLLQKALYRDGTRGKVTLAEPGQAKDSRESVLREAVARICEKAAREQCVITMKPMNSYERRIVHMEVSRHPECGSRSEGDGPSRRVQIFPIRPSESA